MGSVSENHTHVKAMTSMRAMMVFPAFQGLHGFLDSLCEFYGCHGFHNIRSEVSNFHG